MERHALCAKSVRGGREIRNRAAGLPVSEPDWQSIQSPPRRITVSWMPADHTRGDTSRASAFGDFAVGNGSTESQAAGLLRLIAFSLDGEWYGLEVSHVRGIEPESQISPVPRAPAWLLGVFNLHGTILPAIDLRPLLGMADRKKNDATLLLIFHWEGNLAALRVDSVDEMYELPRSSLEPQLATGSADPTELLLGQVRVRDRVIGVIDPDRLVAALVEE